MGTLLVVAALALALVTVIAVGLRKQLRRYEWSGEPRIVELPLEFRPCPTCGAVLWGAVSVDRLLLTGNLGISSVTAVSPSQVKADGSPVTKCGFRSRSDTRAA